MSKKHFSKAIIAYILAVCCIISFNSTAFAINEVAINSINKPDLDVTIKELSIISDQAILQGDTQQMQVEEFDEFTLLNSVEWSSSNPEVISCTSNGKIKGLKKGMATITVKAKIGDAKDSINVYCAKAISPETTSLDFVVSWTCKTPFIFSFQHIYFKFIPMLFSKKVTVKGRYNNYFYVTYTNNDIELDGFVHEYFIPDTVGSDEMLRQLSVYNLNVFSGTTSETKVTTNYKGDVVWTVTPDGIIDFDSKTGTVTAKSPGIATITATSGSTVKTCTVYSIYEWPTQWTGMTNCNTYVYKGQSGTYSTSKYKEEGKLFTVCGDMGDSWAYGYDEYNNWGFIPISHISTKGTVSQYNNMTTVINKGTDDERKVPWRWPMSDESIEYISSPYGPRNITSSGTIHHRGFDITTGVKGEIAGEYVVASCSGTVTKIYNDTSDCGYCISISSDCVDPITNKNISVIYMHLLESPRYENGIKILKGDYITVGTIIGKVGNTNGNTDLSMGYHLHFEANSQNAAVGDPGRNDFTYTINPMYFFVEKKVRFSGTNSYNKYGGYWYDLKGGDQDEESFKSYFIF